MADPMKKFEEKEKYTYADYLTWPDDFRCELINGHIWDMSAAPRRKHQEISMTLGNEFYNFLKEKPCKVYAAPFDVTFSPFPEDEENETDTVVQPDLVVVCDEFKLNDQGCEGAPDLVVEILSPSTNWKDETEKLDLYEKQGVKEYWIINPDRKTIQVFLHNGTDYDKPDYYMGDEEIKSCVMEGFQISLTEIFKTI